MARIVAAAYPATIAASAAPDKPDHDGFTKSSSVNASGG
jgi:hypothetical protein